MQTEQLIERYSSFPSVQSEYNSDGKRITVTRHFTGEKNITQVITELAVNRANREIGLPYA